MRPLPCLVAAAVSLIAGPAAADSTAPVESSEAATKRAEQSPEVDAEKRTGRSNPSALATAAAFVPGILIHGSGHYVAGDTQTALRLLKWQGVGLGLGIASGLFLRYSGGSRYANEITIPMLVSGSGLIINTFLADVYGSAGGGNEGHFEARARQSASLSYAYIKDPQFSYRHFALTAAEADFGPVTIAPSLWTALNDNNQRARLPATYRFMSNDHGEFLEATSAITYHHFGTERFSTYVAELSLGGRIEMTRIGETLRGSFATMSVGAGLHRASYDVAGDIDSDTIGLLLGHFGYGFYLPHGGELEWYYEHRRDDFTAGLSPSSRNGSGFLGHFGLQLRQPINKRFALRARAELGSAWLLASGVEVRWGSTR